MINAGSSNIHSYPQQRQSFFPNDDVAGGLILFASSSNLGFQWIPYRKHRTPWEFSGSFDHRSPGHLDPRGHRASGHQAAPDRWPLPTGDHSSGNFGGRSWRYSSGGSGGWEAMPTATEEKICPRIRMTSFIASSRTGSLKSGHFFLASILAILYTFKMDDHKLPLVI